MCLQIFQRQPGTSYLLSKDQLEISFGCCELLCMRKYSTAIYVYVDLVCSRKGVGLAKVHIYKQQTARLLFRFTIYGVA